MKSSLAVASALFVTMLGTTLPTAIYATYEKTFGLAPLMTPVVYATYAVGVIVTLAGLGYASDEIGRKKVLYAALALAAMSGVVFLCANGLALLLVGRILSGLSAGLVNGAAVAWLVDLQGKGEKQQQHATLIAVGAGNGGLACGPLLGGAIARLTTSPLRLPFAIHLALVVLAAAALAVARETVQDPKPLHLEWRGLKVASGAKKVFVPATIAGAAGFAVAGVVCGIAPAFLAKELKQTSPLVAGLLVFGFFAAAALGQFTVPLLSKRAGLPLGCGVLAAGLGLLATAIILRSTAALFAACLTAGVGQGQVTGFGLASINDKAKDQRSETDSTYYVYGYLAVSVPTVGVGLLGGALGLPHAGLAFAALTGLVVLSAGGWLIAKPAR